MATKKESFNPLEIEDGLFSYESPACLQFAQNTRIHTNSDIETIDSPSNIQETSESCVDHQPDNKKDTSRWHVCKPIRVFYDNGIGEDCRMWPTCNPDLSFCSGYEAVYGKCEHEMLKQWVYFQDHERRDVKWSCMKFADFLHSKPIKPRPCDYSIEEWLKVKIGHTSIENFNEEKVFNEWVLDSFDFEADYAKMFANPYSRRFDEHKQIFEVEQLSNKYELKIGNKGYVLDDVWEKCEQNHGGTTYAWHDEGHEEEELWKCWVEKSEYAPPIVTIETFEVKRYSFTRGRSFICITKQFDDALPLGRANWSQFARMIRKELVIDKSSFSKEDEFEVIPTHNHVVKILLQVAFTTHVLWKPSREFTHPLGPPSGLKGLLPSLNAFRQTAELRVTKESNLDVEEDTRSSSEFLADLNAEFHDRELLANQKRFYKRSRRDEESVSSKDKGVTKVKAFVAIAEDELSVGKADARSGQWIEITIKKVVKTSQDALQSRRQYT
ncbi:hypothetical protein Tco_1477118 [Tanacetum coccineum]